MDVAVSHLRTAGRLFRTGGFSDPMSGVPIQTEISIGPGGQYSQIGYNMATGFMMRIWGTLVALPGGQQLRTQVQGYEPTQFCGPTGDCIPITIPMGETVPIRVIDQNRIQMGPALMQRSR